jgi:hypothetical protein
MFQYVSYLLQKKYKQSKYLGLLNAKASWLKIKVVFFVKSMEKKIYIFKVLDGGYIYIILSKFANNGFSVACP